MKLFEFNVCDEGCIASEAYLTLGRFASYEHKNNINLRHGYYISLLIPAWIMTQDADYRRCRVTGWYGRRFMFGWQMAMNGYNRFRVASYWSLIKEYRRESYEYILSKNPEKHKTKSKYLWVIK